MGLPIRRLILATNENDVLDEFFRTGRYRPRAHRGNARDVVAVDGHLQGVELRALRVRRRRPRSRGVVRALWKRARASGAIRPRAPHWKRVRASGFVSGRSTHADRIATIRRRATGATASSIDPHTADGIKVGASAAAARCAADLHRDRAAGEVLRDDSRSARPRAGAPGGIRRPRIAAAARYGAARRRRARQGVHRGARRRLTFAAAFLSPSPALAYALNSLLRNLLAGLRVAFFLPVTRFAFRVDLVQIVLLFVVSAALDVARDCAARRPRARVQPVRRRHRVLQRRRAAVHRRDAGAAVRASDRSR